MHTTKMKPTTLLTPVLTLGLALICALLLGSCSASSEAPAQQDPNTPPVPDGFEHVEGTVEEGFVIADGAGNQFVWIPVQELVRYDFENATPVEGDSPIGRVFYGEGRKEAITSGTQYDIAHFKDSVAAHGGFYFARYETGDTQAHEPRRAQGQGEAVSQPGVWPYTFATRDDALAVCNAFDAGSEATCTLASSYAWDAAVQFAGSAETNASTSSVQPSLAKTGESGSVAKNIFDLDSNASEWTTEFSSNAYYDFREDCVCRGTSFMDEQANPARRSCNGNVANELTGFRMVLYL